jgi:thiol-disulfide isomerase/thioredoxin
MSSVSGEVLGTPQLFRTPGAHGSSVESLPGRRFRDRTCQAAEPSRDRSLRMADPVAIYEHKKTAPPTPGPSERFYYDSKPQGTGGFKDSKPVFYAYGSPKNPGRARADGPNGMKPYRHETTPPDPPAYYYDDIDGATAIYSHRVLPAKKAALDPDGDRYLLDTTADQTQRGWTKETSPAFYAFAAAKLGTTPIYRHMSMANSAGSGPGSYERYDTQSTGDADWKDGTVAFYALPLGYRIHDTAVQISAPDQQNNVASLTDCLDGAAWVWIDICAGWCAPCMETAKRTPSFLAHVNGQGLKLKVFSVLTDSGNMAPSAQRDADRWANRFNLTDPVVHCGGDPDSDLRELVSRYALANGSTSPGYPTSVLVDPKGVIRYYQLGIDFALLQSHLAQYSGQTLSPFASN